MANGLFLVPSPINEPVLDYEPGSPERDLVRASLSDWNDTEFEVPCVIGGKPVRTGKTATQRVPHRHRQVLVKYHQAGRKEVEAAVASCQRAWEGWSRTPWEDRVAIFLKAAELLAGPFRARINAATMLGQSKTVHQAEIDAACELIDFWRFNCAFMQDIYSEQPLSPPGVWNRVEYRPLEGFVLAVSPFNFTSIGGNLCTAPAIMGNTSIWKPASTAIASNYVIMEVLQEAGLPPGVINFLPGSGSAIGKLLLPQKDLAGIHFTGSTGVFQTMWETVGANIRKYGSYPRLVGETGGKDFVFVHASAHAEQVATALLRGAFEYQGQKCSAASRAYVPKSLWPRIKKHLLAQLAEVKVGDPEDFTNFMGAVIDKASFDKISGYINSAKRSSKTEIIHGGVCDGKTGWFIEPTVVVSEDPKHKLMVEEIFGPVLTIYVYADRDLDKAIELCDTSSPYALTGAVFSQDRTAMRAIANALRHAAGNFYFNDKPTGAVVGQQPFGGGRASGTNDKAGSAMNLLRWTSARSLKETFVTPTDFRYPYMDTPHDD